MVIGNRLIKAVPKDRNYKVFNLLKGDYVDQRRKKNKNLVCITLEGGIKNVNANEEQVYQVLSSTDNTCGNRGFGSGNKPCHEYYITEVDMEDLLYKGSLKRPVDIEASDNFLSQSEIKSLVTAETSSNQIVGLTYLNPKTVKTYTLGNAFTSLHSDMRATFTAPASGNILLDCSFFRDSIDSLGSLEVALADNNKDSLGSGWEKIIHTADRFDDLNLSCSFLLTGLTPGNSYTYYLLFKSNRTEIKIKYGGEYPAFVMKASVLPGTLLT